MTVESITVPRIIIAAASSGSGKTSITLGLAYAFVKQGITISPYKVGPDYIDPGHLSLAAGKVCRNLDPILMGEEEVIKTLCQNTPSGSIALIEGVMGLYDGRGGLISQSSFSQSSRSSQSSSSQSSSVPQGRGRLPQDNQADFAQSSSVPTNTTNPTDFSSTDFSSVPRNSQNFSSVPRNCSVPRNSCKSNRCSPNRSLPGSTAGVAKLLNAPVVVIIDARAAAQTAGAVALGMKLYDPDCPVAGFLINRIGSNRHYTMVKQAVEEAAELPVFGCLPKSDDIQFPERHLGLVPAWESGMSDALKHGVQEYIIKDSPFKTAVEKIADLLTENVDLRSIANEASSAPALSVKREAERQRGQRYGAPLPAEYSLAESSSSKYSSTRPVSKTLTCSGVSETEKNSNHPIKIALAMDHAFHFYYQDNLDYLQKLGAELVFFSPISDKKLPANIDGIYVGGGYPELQAEALSRNQTIIDAVRSAVADQMPVYAECGGLMYLSKSIKTGGNNYNMVGVFDVEIEMGHKLSALGYHNAKTLRESMIGPAGTVMTGHVYRWSRPYTISDDQEWLMELDKEGKISFDGYFNNNAVGSYLHIHFAGTPLIAENFVQACISYNRKRRVVNDNK